jgi:hypothetical protein
MDGGSDEEQNETCSFSALCGHGIQLFPNISGSQRQFHSRADLARAC